MTPDSILDLAMDRSDPENPKILVDGQPFVFYGGGNRPACEALFDTLRALRDEIHQHRKWQMEVRAHLRSLPRAPEWDV